MSALNVVPLVAVVLAACNTAAFSGPSVVDSGPPPCGPEPQIACDAEAPGPQSCTGDPSASGAVAKLPIDASYPLACLAYFSDPDCSNAGWCTCEADDAGVARWRCRP